MIRSRDLRWILAGLVMSQMIIMLIGLIMAMAHAESDKRAKPVIFRPLEPFQPFYSDQRDA